MALSAKAKKRLEVALARRAEANEIIAAIEVPGSTNVAAHVADVATADAATQSGSYVQADAQSVADLANDNKAKINEILAALQAANLMA
jgi:hypothetical protein